MVSLTRRTMGVLAERAKLLLEQSGGQLIKASPKPKIGVLLTNTGTPSGYSYWPMRRYLSQFLRDRRIIEAPALIWYPILYFFILPFRPFKKGKCYKAIWNTEKDESPLRTISRNQAKLLQDVLSAQGQSDVVVSWAFRYGEPSIEEGIAELQKAGCDRLVLFPLYPQYSATTTASMWMLLSTLSSSSVTRWLFARFQPTTVIQSLSKLLQRPSKTVFKNLETLTSL
ncbi:hypothetical protein L596_010582 [Steinernema carpocapsae]|uniref:Ferrochelatase n=1 Tax=Steinernema carpocapsae TaxID=34508 RepID=A0A4U5PJG9_STECR|nr:hypothetical protein L596_010582 [Steinernema carpocapsae]